MYAIIIEVPRCCIMCGGTKIKKLHDTTQWFNGNTLDNVKFLDTAYIPPCGDYRDWCSQIPTWKLTYPDTCGIGWQYNGDIISEVCGKTCGKCTNVASTTSASTTQPTKPTVSTTIVSSTCQDTVYWCADSVRDWKAYYPDPCLVDFYGSLVKDLCPKSCNKCTTPTTTAPCQDTVYWCADSVRDWKAYYPDPCQVDFYGSLVKDLCPKSCFKC